MNIFNQSFIKMLFKNPRNNITTYLKFEFDHNFNKIITYYVILF